MVPGRTLIIAFIVLNESDQRVFASIFRRYIPTGVVTEVPTEALVNFCDHERNKEAQLFLHSIPWRNSGQHSGTTLQVDRHAELVTKVMQCLCGNLCGNPSM